MQRCFVFERTGAKVAWVEGRDVRMTELLAAQRPYCPAEVGRRAMKRTSCCGRHNCRMSLRSDCELCLHCTQMMDSEDLLFILYTSGSTGQPKGCVRGRLFKWGTLSLRPPAGHRIAHHEPPNNPKSPRTAWRTPRRATCSTRP